MNRSAGHFFRMVQDGLWEGIVLHVARLTDPSHSQGRKDRQNLTLHNLPDLIPDKKLKDARNWPAALLVRDCGFRFLTKKLS